MSIRHTKSQVQDNGELEQALTTAEDARDEATRIARELDAARLLLAQCEREILSLHAEMKRRKTEEDARLLEVEDRLIHSQARDALLAEELQVAIEELSVSNQELQSANDDLELRVAERTARIMESERRLLLAQSHAGADIWAWEIPTDIVSWSGNHGQTGGETSATVTTSRASWVRNIHPDDSGRVGRALRECLEQRSADLSVQYRTRHPRKGIRWFEIRGQVSYGKDGSPVRISMDCVIAFYEKPCCPPFGKLCGVGHSKGSDPIYA